MDNLIIGAISNNYTIDKINNWVKSSVFPNVKRVVFFYNYQPEVYNSIIGYLKENNVEIITPTNGLWGEEVNNNFIANSGLLTKENSVHLIHHIRFLHYYQYLKNLEHCNVLLTDTSDVIFNENPFDHKYTDGIIASSEIILHKDEHWNLNNYYTTFGSITQDILNEPIYNAGVIMGEPKILSKLCLDIYLLSINKPRNADQAAYNYLINNSYKDKVESTDLKDNWAVHLHVINEGKVELNLRSLNKYCIIHQYDRINWLKEEYDRKYR